MEEVLQIGEKIEPNDLDVIALYKLTEEPSICFNDTYIYLSQWIKPPLDLKTLPMDFSFEQFKAFINYSFLCNREEKKDKSDDGIHDNIFHPREVIKLELNDFSLLE